MATIHRLKALSVARLSKPGLHPDGRGLFLQVTGSGARSWVLRYALRGRSREMGLGSFPDVTLEAARKAASVARLLRASGVDPIEERRERRAAVVLEAAKSVTFKEAAERYVAAHAAAWSAASHHQWRSSLETYVYPEIGSLPVQAIDTGLVVRVLEPLWTEKTVTATRLRGRIESILDAAKARGLRTGENPARWRGHLDALLAAPKKVVRVEHHAAVPYSELFAFMRELRSVSGPAARSLAFTVLTAARSGEVLGAHAAEFDLAAKLWTVPASRMKGGREHRVPLSDAAVALVTSALKQEGEMPFALDRKGMQLLLKKLRPGTTVHGFRASFKTWATEATHHPREVVEAALAHINGDRVEAAYQRGELLAKRERLMRDWARYIETQPAAAGKVLPLRA